MSEAPVKPPGPGDPHCERCWLHRAHCICGKVPTVAARTELVIIRHSIESYRPSNSARIAALALERCRILTYGAPGETFDERSIQGEGTWVLYPGGPPADLSAGRPRRLVVLDGTWRHARRMYLRIGALRGLPRLSLPAPARPPARRLRRGRSLHEMATLEAIGRALELLEGEEIGRPLLDLYRLFVESALLAAAGGRGRVLSSRTTGPSVDTRGRILDNPRPETSPGTLPR